MKDPPILPRSNNNNQNQQQQRRNNNNNNNNNNNRLVAMPNNEDHHDNNNNNTTSVTTSTSRILQSVVGGGSGRTKTPPHYSSVRNHSNDDDYDNDEYDDEEQEEYRDNNNDNANNHNNIEEGDGIFRSTTTTNSSRRKDRRALLRNYPYHGSNSSSNGNTSSLCRSICFLLIILTWITICFIVVIVVLLLNNANKENDNNNSNVTTTMMEQLLSKLPSLLLQHHEQQEQQQEPPFLDDSDSDFPSFIDSKTEEMELIEHLRIQKMNSLLSSRDSSIYNNNHNTNNMDRIVHYDSSYVSNLHWNPYDVNVNVNEDLLLEMIVVPQPPLLNNFPQYENNNNNEEEKNPSLNHNEDTTTTTITADDDDEYYDDDEYDDEYVYGYGFVRHPDIVDDTIVFVSEGDLYWTRFGKDDNNDSTTTSSSRNSIPAMKIATTIGNILYPKINPMYPYLIAYRATYEGRSEVYLLDIRSPPTVSKNERNRHNKQQRKNQQESESPFQYHHHQQYNYHHQRGSQRLTYMDTPNGISKVIGWSYDGTKLLFSAISNEISFMDERIYEITMYVPSSFSTSSTSSKNVHVLDLRPIPLAQAVDGVFYESPPPSFIISDSNNNNNNNNRHHHHRWTTTTTTTVQQQHQQNTKKDTTARTTNRYIEEVILPDDSSTSENGTDDTFVIVQQQQEETTTTTAAGEEMEESSIVDIVDEIMVGTENDTTTTTTTEDIIGEEEGDVTLTTTTNDTLNIEDANDDDDTTITSPFDVMTVQPPTNPPQQEMKTTTNPTKSNSMDNENEVIQKEEVDTDTCFFFVRTKQYSHTMRYVGGTAESIWAHCTGENVTVHVTHDYMGTNSNPKIITFPISTTTTTTTTNNNNNIQEQPTLSFLLFLSDRGILLNNSSNSGSTTSSSNQQKNQNWIPTSMNLWALPLPTHKALYPGGGGGGGDDASNRKNAPGSSSLLYKYAFNPSLFIQLTQVSCQFHGRSVQEYSMDRVSGRILLRIGADLYSMSGTEVQDLLRTGGIHSSTPRKKKEISKPIRVPIHVVSDFREQQERLIEVKTNTHLHYADMFQTSYDTTNVVATIRGQVWILPVVDDYHNTYEDNPYGGSGQNIPDRRYRIVPGALTGGSIRVLRAIHVPLFVSTSSPDEFSTVDDEMDSLNNSTRNDNNNTTKTKMPTTTTASSNDDGRRLSLILATDPTSPTGEHAFYLLEIQADSINSFTNLHQLPIPFLGGKISGGPVMKQKQQQQQEPKSDGTNNNKIPYVTYTVGGSFEETTNDTGTNMNSGLGSVLPDTVSVSPCGRRFVWADTDNRICVMTLPIYTPGTTHYEKYNNNNNKDFSDDSTTTTSTTGNSTPALKYYCLPPNNEMNEPMMGMMAEMKWSPGGRYLGVQHSARNQFSVITIVDCGPPEITTTTQQQLQTEQPDEDDEDDEDDDSNTTTSTGSSATKTTTTVADINIQSAVQVTPSRFNCYDMYWGISPFDIFVKHALWQMDLKVPASTTLYYLTDRDVVTDVKSPWGTRIPTPHFPKFMGHLFALPLRPKQEPLIVDDDTIETDNNDDDDTGLDQYDNDDVDADHLLSGRFAGGGAMEVFNNQFEQYTDELENYEQLNQFVIENNEIDHNETTMNNERRRRRVLLLHQKQQQHKKRRHLEQIIDIIQKNRNRKLTQHEKRLLSNLSMFSPSSSSAFPQDMEIDFGMTNNNYGDNDDNMPAMARDAYRLSHIPKQKYLTILAQTSDDGSLILVTQAGDSSTKKNLNFFALDYPTDEVTPVVVETIIKCGLSTDRKYFYFTSEMGKLRITGTQSYDFSSLARDDDWSTNRAHIEELYLSVWPTLEYEQMYHDAWRMLRDYFYDVNMHGVDWDAVHRRYRGLVHRCSKREELDDVLGQMISELSALHAFVYGGEYNTPTNIPTDWDPGFLGVVLRRSMEWKGYVITSVPYPDPDFNIMNDEQVYSPLSDQTLRLSGQRGLVPGDVIVGVNGEGVLLSGGADLNSLLRGKAGQSVRLDVLRLQSKKRKRRTTGLTNVTAAVPEPVIVVPIDGATVQDLRYAAWEWKTRRKAKKLAAESGFTVAYVHMRAMDDDGENAFARGYYPDYDKDGLILDVRHNNGGNIDSWIISVLQRKVWSYWSGRGESGPERSGDIDWDEQFAFRGKIVVLIDEFTASNGEGVSRGLSELKIATLIGKRTWGGGIWGSSANHLVDGGIAAAPQWGVFIPNTTTHLDMSQYNGWGAGVEMSGVAPDIEVDNDPFETYHGRDAQLEFAIHELKNMILMDPIPPYQPPPQYPDMSVDDNEYCQRI